MKITLADGTSVAIQAYEKTATTVNGNTVDAVSFLVTGKTLEEVKALFTSGSNLAEVNVYTDENSKSDTFLGYEVRKSIALTEVDDEYLVLLAKSSEVDSRLGAVEKQMGVVASSVATMESSVQQNATSIEGIEKTVTELGADSVEMTKSIQTVSETLDTISRAVAELQKSVGDVSGLKTEFAQIKEDVTSSTVAVNSAVSELANAVSSIAVTLGETATNAETAKNTVALLEDTVSLTNIQAQEAKEAAANADNNFIMSTQSMTNMEKTVETVNSTIESVKEESQGLSETVASVDLSVKEIDQRVSVLEPIKDITTLSLSEAKKYRVAESSTVLAEYLAAHPITSSCHGGVAATYTITKEKQSLLQAMILTTQIAAQNNLDYTPSWNATGEVCSYDWTLAELTQLAFEIEAAVHPAVSKQQAIEKEILAATTMDQLVAVTISYNDVTPNAVPQAISAE